MMQKDQPRAGRPKPTIHKPQPKTPSNLSWSGSRKIHVTCDVYVMYIYISYIYIYMYNRDIISMVENIKLS